MNRTRPVLTLKKPSRSGRKPETKSAPVRKKSAPRRNKVVENKVVELRRPTDQELLMKLKSTAPELWEADAPVPLAIGIHKQLYPVAERVQMSRRALRKFLSRWTSTLPYQRALSQPDARRFNLDGSPAGEVSEQHREEARQRLARERPPA